MVGCFKLLLPAVALLAVLGEIEVEVQVEKLVKEVKEEGEA